MSVPSSAPQHARPLPTPAAPVERRTCDGLRVEVLNHPSQWQAVAAQWRNLSALSPQALPFNDLDWINSFWTHLAKQPFLGDMPQACVVLAWQDSRLVGVAPWRLHTLRVPGLRVRVARWLAEGPSDYADLLLAPAGPAQQQAWVQALLQPLLQGRFRCELLDLRECRGDSPLLPLLRLALQQHTHTLQDQADSPCHAVPAAASWDAYAQSQFSGKRRKDFRREWRHLADAGGFDWGLHGDSLGLERLADEFGEVQASHRHAGEDRPGEFNHPQFGLFLRQCMASAAGQGQLRAAWLRRHGELLAYWLVFAYGPRYYLYNTAHRSQVQPYGGGKLLMLYLLEQLINEGRGPVDFLRGAEAYKEVLSDHVVQNRRLQAATPGLRGRWAAWWWLHWIPHAQSKGGRAERLLVQLGTLGLRSTLVDLARRAARRLTSKPTG